MKIDLRRIPTDRPVAIHIPTKEHGKVFLEAMRTEYPRAVYTWDKPHFLKARVDDGDENYYFPRLHLGQDAFMTHGGWSTYEEMGVSFMSFDDLLVPDEELKTSLGDVALEALFDMG